MHCRDHKANKQRSKLYNKWSVLRSPCLVQILVYVLNVTSYWISSSSPSPKMKILINGDCSISLIGLF